MWARAILAMLVGLGVGAYAGESVELEPRVRVPGESSVPRELTASESFLAGLGMTADDIKAVKEKAEALNKERPTLIKEIDAAREGVKAAQKKLDEAVANVEKQEAALHDFIRERLAQDQRADYTVRLQLQPVIDWLKLTGDQVTNLVGKQKELLANDPRSAMAEASRAMQEKTAPLSAEQRKAYIELLRKSATFNATWLSNIESVLTDEQKQTWRTRYRRTSFPVDFGAAAPAAEAPAAAKEEAPKEAPKEE